MLWSEKYRPQSLNEYKCQRSLVESLSNYTVDTIPHLLIHGMPGSGKKTLVLNLLKHLFNKEIDFKLKTTQIKTTKTIDVSFLESDEAIEITPSDYGFQDRMVVQSLLKNMTQTKPILNMLFQKERINLRFIILNEADLLSKDAQAALRRTLEKYSTNFRLIMISDELNTIIEPLRSRCLSLRVRGFSNEEISNNLKMICAKENVSLVNVDEIINKSNGNMRLAICYAESLCNFSKDDKEKRKKAKFYEKALFLLDYEKIILNIVNEILSHREVISIINTRKHLYELLCSCIPGRVILKEMVQKLLEKELSFEKAYEITELATKYDERLKIGSKDIMHLEAFVIQTMCLF